MARCKLNFIEIPIIISVFSLALTINITTNLIIYRTCYVVLGYNQSICALLGNENNNQTEEIEKLVEPKAAVINMVRGTIETCLTLILCIFIGSWSDRFGRKPVLMMNLLGSSLSFVLMAFFSFWDSISPWYLILISIPSVVTGGANAFFIVTSAYVTDTSSEEHRGLRMSLLESIFAIGFFLGNTSSSYLFYATNYISVYGIAAACFFLALLYSIFFLPESVQHIEIENKFESFFQISNMKQMLKVTFTRRDHFNRPLIFVCMFILIIGNITMIGDMSLNFMFMRTKFEWTLQKYTLFTSASTLIYIAGQSLGGYVLHQLLKVNEPMLALIGCISTLNGLMVTGLATQDWHIYLGAVVNVLGGLVSPMLRSFISKLVHVDEVGKIYSGLTICVSLFGMTAAPLYTYVYNTTINSNPAIFCFVSAGFYAVNIILTIVVLVLHSMNSYRFNLLDNDEDEYATEDASVDTDSTEVVS